MSSDGALARREVEINALRISYLTKGTTGPATLYLHGLGADAHQTRPLASGVPGRSVLVDLPSHGQSQNAPDQLGFAQVVEIARSIAAAEGVTRALGVSLGSAVLLRWLTMYPNELERAVCYLPASVTAPRPSGRLARALADDESLAEYVGGELPAEIAATPLAQRWLSDRTQALRRPGILAYATMLESAAPVIDSRAATGVSTDILAIGARGDRLHDAQAATDVARAFGNARAHIFPAAAPLWTARRELRRLISEFLGGSATVES